MSPDLALQKAIGDVLASVPAILAHVDPLNIRAGSIRDEDMPAIQIGSPAIRDLRRSINGHAVADLGLVVHIWAVEDNSDVAQVIAGAAMNALVDAPRVEGARVDAWERPTLVWLRDPDPAQSYSHAAISLRAQLAWRLDQ